MKVPVLAIALFFSYYSFSQSSAPVAEDYTQVVNKRAEKIVTRLHIADSSRFYRVRNIIAGQYVNLNTIQTTQDQKLAQAKLQTSDKAIPEAKSKIVAEETAKQLDSLHGLYISRLNKELNKDQLEAVKDGMTYGVLPITYSGYQDMLPDLTKEQKAQILSYLTEAREKAMDAGSSEEKHKWFGKYKGKINNYLSGQGYNMKKAGEEWQARIKARETTSK